MKTRADLLLVERGLASSRAQAQALILAGKVYSHERRIDKPGSLLASDLPLCVRQGPRYVSRGGNKLEGALDDLKLEVTGAVAADIGASTGGFTDCLLQRGAARVYAIDVGHGQLAARLRDDPRVVVMERTNARYLEADAIPERLDWVVVDASFIGIGKLVGAIAALLPDGGQLLALVKPQFEVGKEQARRERGVIKDPAVRAAGIAGARAAVIEAGFEVLGESPSRLPGPKGNVEHFLWARKHAS
ncbi:MAG TPA: TlyA family RNA methyltransferase [Polyangiaceae bacterium]|nr:TlyA family RNA methyltransferase [Polyangiaceae bacterium]